MRVRALEVGYYGLIRRREGSEFTLKPYKKFKRDGNGTLEKDKDGKPIEVLVTAQMQLAKWMHPVSEKEAAVSKAKRKTVAEVREALAISEFDNDQIIPDGDVPEDESVI
jgi:hypothetical protein